MLAFFKQKQFEGTFNEGTFKNSDMMFCTSHNKHYEKVVLSEKTFVQFCIHDIKIHRLAYNSSLNEVMLNCLLKLEVQIEQTTGRLGLKPQTLVL